MVNASLVSPSPLSTQASRDVTDRQLLERFLARRDEGAFASLVQRHGKTVWGVCRRVLHHEHDTEDAFQAVFLILARRAGAIREGEAVGSWLYGVAYRVAMKARQTAARRQAREKQASEAQPPPPPWGEAAWRELQRLLDEEVQGLADKYRAPFVLCCLEGMSKTEAAQELGWKEGTVSGRLAQARKLLQSRLARRGITLTAVLTATTLVQGTAAAAAPVVLVSATAQAVLAPAAGAVSPSVFALAQGVMHAMTVAKVKAGLGLMLALTTVVAAASAAALQLMPPPAQVAPVEVPVALNDPENFLPPGVPLWQPLDEQVLGVAVTADGKKVITAGARYTRPGQLMIWDAVEGKELARLRGIRGTRCVALSPDGKTLATGEFGGAIKLRDPDTGQERAELKGHVTGVNSLAFSSDGQLLASAGLDRVAKVWDMKELKERQEFRGHTDMIFSIAFFANGKALLTGGQDKTAKVWDVENGKEKFTLQGHPLPVEAVAVSPDDKLVVTACWDSIVRLWDAATGKEAGALHDNSPVYALAFSPPDGKLLATATAGGTVMLWDPKTQKPLRQLERHASAIWSLAFTADAKTLVSGSSDKTAKSWDVETGREVHTFDTGTPDPRPIRALAYAPGGQVVAISIDDNNTVQVRDARTGELLHVLAGHENGVTCLAFSPDGQTLASGSADQTLKLWDWAARKERLTLKGHTDVVTALVFSKDGTRLASAGDDQTVRWWDATSGNELSMSKGHDAPIRALALSPKDGSLASGDVRGAVKVWTAGKETEPAVLKGHEKGVRALAFAPDGTLASAGEDGKVKLWEADGARAERQVLQGHASEAWSLAFSPGGRTLVSGGQDGSVIVWDLARGQPRGVLKSHTQGVTALAIHPQGENLLSGSQDATVRRWTAAPTAAPPVTLQGNPEGTWFAQFSPAGDRLVTGGMGGTVTLWTKTLSPAEFPFRSRAGVYWDAAFSKDGKFFAVGGGQNLLVFDARTGQVKHTIPFSQAVSTVAFSPDSRYLAAGTGNWSKPDTIPECCLLDVATGAKLADLPGHTTRLFRVLFSPDGKLLATSSRDKTIRLWEVSSGKHLGTLRGPNAPAKGMVFLPDGTLVTASYDAHIRFWDVATARETRIIQAGMALASLDVSPDGTLLVAAESASEGQGAAPLKIWDVATGKELRRLEGHGSRILGVSFTPDGRGVVAGGGTSSAHGEINCWDLASGQLRGSHKTARNWMETAVVSPDGKYVLTPSVAGLHAWNLDFTHAERTWQATKNGFVSCGLFYDGGKKLATGTWSQVVSIWNVATGEHLGMLKGHTNGIRSLAVLPDGKTLVSSSEDRTVKLWDLSTFKEKATLQGNTMIAYSVAVSPDGKTLATGGGDHRKPVPGEVILWDVATGKPRLTFPNVERAVFSLSYSPDGKLLAGSIAYGAACAARVWNAQTGQVLANMPLPYIRPVAFSPDGKLLAAGGGRAPTANEPGSATIRVWETATWKERALFKGHTHVLFSLAFSPDGTTLASACQDETVKLWSPPTAEGDRVLVFTGTGSSPVLPGRVPPVGPSGVTAVPPPIGVTDADAGALPRSRWKIWLAGCIAGLVASVGLGVWLAGRRKRPVEGDTVLVPEKPSEEKPTGAPTVSFACAGCGKKLRARVEQVGKKLKCPGCGRLVVVSSSEAAP